MFTIQQCVKQYYFQLCAYLIEICGRVIAFEVYVDLTGAI